MTLHWLRYWFIPHTGKSLLMVALLGLAVFFCYSLISFAFFRETFLKEDDGRHCRTVYHCFITMIHHGFVDSPYTVGYFWWNSHFAELHCTFCRLSKEVLLRLLWEEVQFWIIVHVLKTKNPNKNLCWPWTNSHNVPFLNVAMKHHNLTCITLGGENWS